MAIVALKELLMTALCNSYCIGYFEAWDQYSLEVVLEAAEETNSPTILGFGAAVTNQDWLNRWGVEELSTLAHSLGEQSKVPTAVLFNEARTSIQILRGIRAGCNAVMLDTSSLPVHENIKITRQIVEIAHGLSVDVEAELGHLPDANYAEMEAGIMTDVGEVVEFVQATGVDALAVSIGNIHALTKHEASIDLNLLESIHQQVRIPLVLHGGSSFPAAMIKEVIQRGVAKINYGTRLKEVFLEGMQEGLAVLPERFNIHDFMGSKDEKDILIRGKIRMKAEVTKLMQLYGTAGQAVNW